MSIPSASGPTGLPVVNQALEPAWVRHGSASVKQAYESALSFEATLVEQLSRSLSSSGSPEGESSVEGESGEGASGVLSAELPQALSSGIMSAGGLGLAAQLTHSFQGLQGQRAAATGGTSPSGGGTSPAAAVPASSSISPASGGTGAAATGGIGA